MRVTCLALLQTSATRQISSTCQDKPSDKAKEVLSQIYIFRHLQTQRVVLRSLHPFRSFGIMTVCVFWYFQEDEVVRKESRCRLRRRCCAFSFRRSSSRCQAQLPKNPSPPPPPLLRSLRCQAASINAPSFQAQACGGGLPGHSLGKFL